MNERKRKEEREVKQGVKRKGGEERKEIKL